MKEPDLFSLKDVSKSFPGARRPAVDGVTLSAAHGCLLGLLGPSGCGKTTLLRLIAGFEAPDSGEIRISGKPVAGSGHWTPPESRGVGMVFQDYALFPHLTLAENIAFGLRRGEGVFRTAQVIEMTGLRGLEKRYPHELSGGQQQRAALARALAPRPDLILLDEPLSNVDVQMRARLRQEVREILKAEGVTAVFVTHDQEEALSISDCVVVMRDGRIEQIGDPETLYQRPASRFVAEFVAQANFLHARLQDGQWVTEAGVFDVVPGSSFEGATGDLMIRQEDLEFFPDDAGPAVVVDRHFLGRECRYRLRTVSGRILLARTATEQILAPGTRVVLSVAAHKIRLFGAEAAMAGNLAARGD